MRTRFRDADHAFFPLRLLCCWRACDVVLILPVFRRHPDVVFQDRSLLRFPPEGAVTAWFYSYLQSPECCAPPWVSLKVAT